MTVDGCGHSLQPGVAVYAYKGSQVRIVPQSGGSVSYLLIEPVPAAVVQRWPMRVTAAEIGRDGRPPHQGTGDSTSYRYTDLQPGLDVELRKRTLRRGAAVGTHHLGQDQLFYVLAGEIDFVADGESRRLRGGTFIYSFKGTAVEIRQHGAAPATYIAAWVRAIETRDYRCQSLDTRGIGCRTR
jgi:mannose-6-phosphate isomerase-like protein (cupin superfamily)